MNVFERVEWKEPRPVERFGETPVKPRWHWVELTRNEYGEWDYVILHRHEDQDCPHWRQYQGNHVWLSGWDCPEGWFVDECGFDPADYFITEPGEYKIKFWSTPAFYSPCGYTTEADFGLEVQPWREDRATSN